MSGPINIPNTAGVVTVNTSNAEKTLLLPLTASIYGKIITIKDISSNAANCNITIQTQYPPDLFEDGTSNYLLKTNFGSVTFLAKSNTWYTLNNSSGSTNSIIDTNNLTVASNFYVGTGARFYTNNIYAAGYENTKILQSGQTYRHIYYYDINNNLDTNPHTINGIGYSPTSGTTVALTDNSNIWRSLDGSNFNLSYLFNNPGDPLSFDPNDNPLSFDSLGFGNINNGGDIFFLVNSNYIYLSLDIGLTWYDIGLSPDDTGSGTITSMNFNSNTNSFLLTISGGLHNFCYYDVIGTTISNPRNIFTYGANKAFWNGSLWVAVGSNTNGKNIAYSPDGDIWSYASNLTLNTNTFFENFLENDYGEGTSIYYANNIWVAVGRATNAYNYNIYISPDGSNFTQSQILQSSYNDVVYNISENRWILTEGNSIDIFINNGSNLTFDVGNPYIIGNYDITNLFTTIKPSNYPQVHITPNTISALNILANNITVTKDFYVGTGSTYYTGATYAAGIDDTQRLQSGQTFKPIYYYDINNNPDTNSHTINAIGYSPTSNITVALTDNSNIWRSLDGSNFNLSYLFNNPDNPFSFDPNDNPLSFDSLGFGNINFGGISLDLFLVANSNYMYANLNNGSNWGPTDVIPDNGGSGIITSINFNRNSNSFLLTISGGDNNFCYFDIIGGTITPTYISNIFSIGANKAFWNGSLWVAVGSNINGNNIAYSSDGVNWSYALNLTTSTNTFFEYSGGYGEGKGIYYANGIWIAVGTGDLNNCNIYVSPDGIEFTQNQVITNSYNDVVYDISGNIWCAAADGIINNNIDVFTNNGITLTSDTYYSLVYTTTKLFTTVQSRNYSQVHITSNTISADNIYVTNTISTLNIYATNYFYNDGTPLSNGGGGGGGGTYITNIYNSSNPGVSTLSSIVAYGLSSVNGGFGLSSLSSIVAYGLSSVNGGAGLSSLSSIVAYGLSSVNGGEGISSLSSIVAYGLSSVNGGEGISSLSSIVAYGLSSVNGGTGISSLSSIVAYGLS